MSFKNCIQVYQYLLDKGEGGASISDVSEALEFPVKEVTTYLTKLDSTFAKTNKDDHYKVLEPSLVDKISLKSEFDKKLTSKVGSLLLLVAIILSLASLANAS